MTIICLTGTIGVGKDTMADYLVERYGYVKIGMADPMKRIVKDVYEFTDEQLWGASDKRNFEDPRYPRLDSTFLSARVALQLLGNEWSRVCYPETWPVYMKRVIAKVEHGYFYSESKGAYEVEGQRSHYAGVVISNCRFRNELEEMREVGAVAVRLRRPALDVSRALATGVKNHATEVEQLSIPDDFFDLVIDVPEGTKNFYQVIDEHMKKLVPAPLPAAG